VFKEFFHIKLTSVPDSCCSFEVSVASDAVCSLTELGIIFWILSLNAANGCVITSRITSKVVFVSVDAFSSDFGSLGVSI